MWTSSTSRLMKQPRWTEANAVYTFGVCTSLLTHKVQPALWNNPLDHSYPFWCSWNVLISFIPLARLSFPSLAFRIWKKKKKRGFKTSLVRYGTFYKSIASEKLCRPALTRSLLAHLFLFNSGCLFSPFVCLLPIRSASLSLPLFLSIRAGDMTHPEGPQTSPLSSLSRLLSKKRKWRGFFFRRALSSIFK